MKKIKWFYHGTTLENYTKIQDCGFLDPSKSNGNTYKNTLFLTNSDKFARCMTAFKHSEFNGQEVVIYKIPGHILDKKSLSIADKHHTKGMFIAGDNIETFAYTKPIPVEETLVAKVAVNLNLPEGVSIYRDGPKTGFSFTREAAEKLGIDYDSQLEAQQCS